MAETLATCLFSFYERSEKGTSLLGLTVDSGGKGHKQDTFLQSNEMLRYEYPNRSARKEEVLIIKDKTREWKGKFKKRTSKQGAYHKTILFKVRESFKTCCGRIKRKKIYL